MSSPQLVPDDFEVPRELVGDGFRLEPLGPEHNESDHTAWMSSIDHIRATPGYPDGTWPRPMSLEDNLSDLTRHRTDFESRRGFTYTVLDPAGVVIGCVYIYPSAVTGSDAEVSSWVTSSRAELDRPLWQAVSTWLRDSWPFAAVTYASRDA